MVAKLPGYVRERGSARGYISPSGERLSYRTYRTLLERNNLVQRLEAAELANVRRRQREFNDIIRQMSKVQAEALDRAIELAEEIGEDEDEIIELKMRRRRVKSEAIRSPQRKSAIQTLKDVNRRNARQDHFGAGFGRYQSAEDELQVRNALIALGRRQGIPDWVPVGASDRFRAGKLRHNRLPREYRGFNTRASK